MSDLMHGISVQELEILDWCAAQQDEMVQRLERLVGINSGSDNPAGINQCGELMQIWFQSAFPDLQCVRHTLPDADVISMTGESLARPLGDLWQFSRRPEAPLQILLCGHLDTVFGSEHPFQTARYLTADILNGPGAADMKGGLLVMLTALHALEQHPACTNLGWTVLLNPDEEIGSPGSADWLTKLASQHHLGLVFEPALPNGNLAGARKGSGNFTCIINGRSAHAGRNPEEGRNAIVLAAELIQQLNHLNHQRPDLTLNVGVVQGGHSTNQVPDLCVFRFNIRISEPADANWCEQQLKQLSDRFAQRDGYNLQLHGGFGRMPKTLHATQLTLLRYVQTIAAQLSQPLAWQDTGGCCDGNNLAAAGLINVDTLGVRGQNIHTDQETIELKSLTDRSQLTALLLLRLAQSGWPSKGVL
ncbi:hydrolase [Neptuniibacter sp. CAU 1671]|uniref:hydrolase n=1 Tax=Neptuniibacter sp. CAU 1671 TaxID=3032593 RepID=UPI0023DAC0A0|nr:hydrolase [Neptuniibacter sp. CAU 1671]MDF2182530.1 hydrolase [Neptuniibacter sp. CAU 1671]